MKAFYTIFLLIFLSAGNCLSQTTSASTFYINKLPAEGVLLDKGWKFIADDNPDYAKSDYDDSKWQDINPASDVHDLPVATKTGICWLRLRFVIDSNLMNEQLALLINQVVASEIYLNGRLINRLGTISINPKKITAYDPSGMHFSVSFDKSTKQLLAVRYEIEPHLLYTTALGENALLKIRINKIETAIDRRRWYERSLPSSISFRIGAFLILAVLYLAFFFYYPERKANLFFCLYALLQIVAEVLGLNLTSEIEVKYIYFLTNFMFAFWDLARFFLLTALYSLLGQKRGWIYWALLIAVITGIFLNSWGYPQHWEISQVLISNLVNIEIVRTAFKALKLRTRGAWIITTGAISFLTFWAAYVLGMISDYRNIPISKNYILGDVLFNLYSLSIPMATAIYLALEFGFTSHALKQKLIEVEQLSQKNHCPRKRKTTNSFVLK